jgi:hypothetical protein
MMATARMQLLTSDSAPYSMPPLLTLLLLGAGLLPTTSVSSFTSSLKITALRRTVDLTSSVERTTTILRIRNAGAADAASVLFAVDATRRVAYMSFETPGPTAKPLAFTKADATLTNGAAVPPGFDLYSIAVTVPQASSLELLARIVCVGSMTPRPATVAQGQPQVMEYGTQRYAPSPYYISGPQTTEFVLPTTPVQYTHLAARTQATHHDMVLGDTPDRLLTIAGMRRV